MHMLTDNTPRYCEKHNCGPRRYSEEAAESLHAECNKYVKRWKVPTAGHPKYDQVVEGIPPARKLTRSIC